MSLKVELDELDETLRRFGAAFLLTADAERRVKIVAVPVELRDGELRCGASPGTARNLANSATISLAFWPLAEDQMSLIVDGEGRAEGDEIVVRPTGAVLHRPAR